MIRQERIRLGLDLVSTIAIVTATIAVVSLATGRSPTADATGRAPNAPWQEVSGLETMSTTTDEHDRPKVAIVEFSDFKCPYCAKFAAETFPTLKKDYIDTGAIEYVFRNFPLEMHAQAFKAAEAAECAQQQGSLLPMRDVLFANQRSLAESQLATYAKSIGLDASRFSNCIDGTTAEKIRNDQAEGARLGINSTPTFLVGYTAPGGRIKLIRRILGAVPYAAFKSSIDDLLKSAPSL